MRIRSIEEDNVRIFLFLVSPALILLLLIFLLPLVISIIISFTHSHSFFIGNMRFVGITNYIDTIFAPAFLQALRQTILFVVCTITLELILGFIVALLLNIGTWGSNYFRIIFSIPLIIAPIVSGLQWRWLFSDQYGVINHLLNLIGITGPFWLADVKFAGLTILISNLWLATPFVILVLMAGLANISKEQHEAALIDGANKWQIFWRITLIQLKPTILVILIIRLTDAIRIYDIVYILTGGGPAATTEVLSSFIYKRIFTNLQFGQGAAASFLVLLLIGMISLFCNKLLEEKD